MSQIAEMLLKEAAELREAEEWTQVKQAAVEALVQSGLKRNVAEQILDNLQEGAQ